ncbi:MAG: ribose 5-phosphate isomerase B [Dehalococcoidales bacterium]|nr:ribose 5-phosphate isomerase B [Dehalococcoidales bacterium]
MKIAIGSDHRGLEYKKYVCGIITETGHSYHDFGSYTSDPVDYPDIARLVGEAVAGNEYDLGILICGTGIGMSIAANKVRNIRAALCSDVFSAKRARSHNDANIVCLGAERGTAAVRETLEAFFSTQFEGGRHQHRVDKISRMENEPC